MRTVVATPEVVVGKKGNTDLLDQVLAYKHPELVERFKRNLGLKDKDAQQLFDDVKKFLYLCVTTRQGLAPPSKIDVGWHEFLMYTKDYSKFCNQLFGRLIHHEPAPLLKPHAMSSVADTISLARHTFGGLSKNWTPASGTTCEKASSKSASF